MDRNPAAIGFASSRGGLVLLYVAFLTALWLADQLPPVATAMIALTLAACMAWPQRRLAIMAAAGALYFCARPYRTEQQIAFAQTIEPLVAAYLPAAVPSHTPAAAFFLCCVYLATSFVLRRPGSPLSRRPVISLLVAFGVLTGLGLAAPAGGTMYVGAWYLATILAASFFFVAYGLAEARTDADTPASLRAGFVRPFWSGPSVPIKGPSYLRKFEAKTPEELAAARLRALKLIVWAAILAGLCRLIEIGAYDIGGLSPLQPTIAATAEGNGPGRAMAWLVLLKSFLLNVLSLGAILHTLVAIIRFCGYAIPRGMARPLSSRTIAEFWNRYYFYFKEMLVDFFFYPAFVRFFKKSPKLRIAFATFSAAFVGNLLFSVLSQPQLFAEIGVTATLLRFDSYAVYAAALTLALIASQLRSHKPRPEHGFLRYEVTPRLTVLGFFCMAQIFADESGFTTLSERAAFMAYLVSL